MVKQGVKTKVKIVRTVKDIEKMLVCVSEDLDKHIKNKHGKGRASVKCPACSEGYGKMYILEWTLGMGDWG